MGTIRVEKWIFKNATKDYDVALCVNVELDNCVVIRRWGKIKQLGRANATQHASLKSASEFIAKAVDTRITNGYIETKKKDNVEFTSLEDLYQHLNQRPINIVREDLRSLFVESADDEINALFGKKGTVIDDLSTTKVGRGIGHYGESSSWASW
jgi:predicted DNA-binding WGR domain protein